MTPEQFDQTLRSFVRREPFFPFVVELKDGRRHTFHQPHLAFGGGTAGFLSDTDDLVDFSCEQVLNVRFALPEDASS